MSSTLFVKAFLQGSYWMVLTERNGNLPWYVDLLGLFNSPCAASVKSPSSKKLGLFKTFVKVEKLFQVNHCKDDVVVKCGCGNMKKNSI